jgi:hypothetical protein
MSGRWAFKMEISTSIYVQNSLVFFKNRNLRKDVRI